MTKRLVTICALNVQDFTYQMLTLRALTLDATQ
jgi:hypothetical protein